MLWLIQWPTELGEQQKLLWADDLEGAILAADDIPGIREVLMNTMIEPYWRFGVWNSLQWKSSDITGEDQ